ncbi:MAG TPA: PP2C family serine/threonine-protein phosphatase [Methylomirabilota bacterium]|nr:PP2C family serine/threonine-protein phosphatase [Methylomirabilota bacterium]
MKLEAHGLTDPGRKRKGNEDSMGLDPALGLAIVADGMGGHQSGEVASQLAVEKIRDFVARAHQDRDLTWPFGIDAARSFEANCLSTGIKLANQAVLGAAAGRAELTGMGTTVVAVLAREGHLHYAGVGDSRAYLLRGGQLHQLTRDDSWLEAAVAQQLIEARDLHEHPFRHVLTKAVGLQEELDFEIGDLPLEAGDRVLLCSDGLTTALSDEQIQAVLGANQRDLPSACQALIAAANEAGGPDNVTVIMLRHGPG